MSSTTRIEWCDATWNPITGCTPCSPGCAHCYARTMLARHLPGHKHPGDPGTVTYHPDRLDVPEHWRRPRKIFVCSLSDLFHDAVAPNWRKAVFYTMRAPRARHHTYLLLTKRAETQRAWFTMLKHSSDTLWPLPNVVPGITITNQPEADRDIPILLQTPAARRFLSVEPMLGSVDLWGARFPAPGGGLQGAVTSWPGGLDWVICGGETGAGARPCHPAWVRSLRDQCIGANVPFFFKGWGDWLPLDQVASLADPSRHVPNRQTYHTWPDGLQSVHCPHKYTPALLDGLMWHQFPSFP